MIKEDKYVQIIQGLKRDTGLDINDEDWSELAEVFPRETAIVDLLLEELVAALNPYVGRLEALLPILPESVRELALDRLVAMSAVNMLASTEFINDVVNDDAVKKKRIKTN